MINKIYRDLFELPEYGRTFSKKIYAQLYGKYPNYEIIQDNLGPFSLLNVLVENQ